MELRRLRMCLRRNGFWSLPEDLRWSALAGQGCAAQAGLGRLGVADLGRLRWASAS